MLFPLLQKPMSLVIRFLSTPKIGYPYQIDPQLLTQVAGQIDTWDHCISTKFYPQRVSYLTPFFLPTMMSAEWYPRQTMAANKHVFSLSSRPTSLSSAVNYRGGMRYRWWLPARLVELQRSSDIGGLFA